MLFARPTACTTFSFSFRPFAFNSIHSMTELGMLLFYYYSAFSYLAVIFRLCRYLGLIERLVGACLYKNDPFRKEPCRRAVFFPFLLFSIALSLSLFSHHPNTSSELFPSSGCWHRPLLSSVYRCVCRFLTLLLSISFTSPDLVPHLISYSKGKQS